MQRSSTKCLQTKFNNILKASYTMIKQDLVQGYKVGSHQEINITYYINKINDKNHMIISIDTEIALAKFNIHL